MDINHAYFCFCLNANDYDWLIYWLVVVWRYVVGSLTISMQRSFQTTRRIYRYAGGSGIDVFYNYT